MVLSLGLHAVSQTINSSEPVSLSLSWGNIEPNELKPCWTEHSRMRSGLRREHSFWGESEKVSAAKVGEWVYFLLNLFSDYQTTGKICRVQSAEMARVDFERSYDHHSYLFGIYSS